MEDTPITHPVHGEYFIFESQGTIVTLFLYFLITCVNVILFFFNLQNDSFSLAGHLGLQHDCTLLHPEWYRPSPPRNWRAG